MNIPQYLSFCYLFYLPIDYAHMTGTFECVLTFLYWFIKCGLKWTVPGDIQIETHREKKNKDLFRNVSANTYKEFCTFLIILLSLQLGIMGINLLQYVPLPQV